MRLLISFWVVICLSMQASFSGEVPHRGIASGKLGFSGDCLDAIQSFFAPSPEKFESFKELEKAKIPLNQKRRERFFKRFMESPFAKKIDLALFEINQSLEGEQIVFEKLKKQARLLDNADDFIHFFSELLPGIGYFRSSDNDYHLSQARKLIKQTPFYELGMIKEKFIESEFFIPFVSKVDEHFELLKKPEEANIFFIDLNSRESVDEFLAKAERHFIDSELISQLIKKGYYFKSLKDSKEREGIEKLLTALTELEDSVDYRRQLSLVLRSEKTEKLFEEGFSEVNDFSGFIHSLIILAEKTRIDGYSNLVHFSDQILETQFAKSQAMKKEQLSEVLREIDSHKKVDREVILSLFEEKWRDSGKNFRSNSKFDHVLETITVKDQCQWGSCWIHSSVEKLELDLLHQSEEGIKVELSADYVYIRYLMDTFFGAIINGNQVHGIQEGGFKDNFPIFVEKYGLVPEKVWSLKGRGFFSSGQGRDLIYHSVSKIQKQYSEKLELAENLYPDGIPEEALEEIKVSAFGELRTLFETHVGKFPEEFLYQGKRFTPNTFADQFHDFWSGYEEIVTANDFGHGPRRGEVFSFFDDALQSEERILSLGRTRTLPFQEIEEIIIESLREGRAINASVRNFSQYLRKGLKRVYKDGSEKAIANDRHGFHAIVIVGYELDLEGNLKTLRILNSWGDGLISVDRSYFVEELRDIVVHEKDGLAMQIIPAIKGFKKLEKFNNKLKKVG